MKKLTEKQKLGLIIAPAATAVLLAGAQQVFNVDKAATQFMNNRSSITAMAQTENFQSEEDIVNESINAGIEAGQTQVEMATSKKSRFDSIKDSFVDSSTTAGEIEYEQEEDNKNAQENNQDATINPDTFNPELEDAPEIDIPGFVFETENDTNVEVKNFNEDSKFISSVTAGKVNEVDPRLYSYLTIGALGAGTLAVTATLIALAVKAGTRGKGARKSATKYNICKNNITAPKNLYNVNMDVEKHGNGPKDSRLKRKFGFEKDCYNLAKDAEKNRFYNNKLSGKAAKFLEEYATRSLKSAKIIGGRNKEYLSKNGINAQTATDYINLMNGLKHYAQAAIKTEKGLTATKETRQAKDYLNKVAFLNVENIYFGKTNTIYDERVATKPFPVLPQRYISTPLVNEDTRNSVENFFDIVSAINSYCEKSATYGEITFKISGESKTISYGFDNKEGAKLLKDLFICAIPENATNISIVETVQQPRKRLDPIVENLSNKELISRKESAINVVKELYAKVEAFENGKDYLTPYEVKKQLKKQEKANDREIKKQHREAIKQNKKNSKQTGPNLEQTNLFADIKTLTEANNTSNKKQPIVQQQYNASENLLNEINSQANSNDNDLEF